MDILEKLNTNITLIISIITIFVAFSYFFINLSYKSFREKFKIGYNEIWSKYEVSMALFIFCIGFVLGLYICFKYNNISELKVFRTIGKLFILIVLISYIIFQHFLKNRLKIISIIGKNRSKFMNYIISASSVLFFLATITYGFMSAIPVFIAIEDGEIYLALIVLFVLIMYSFSFFGNLNNFVNIIRMGKKNVIMNDGITIECYIIGIEDGFLVVKRDNYLEHINLSLINRIYEEVKSNYPE